MLMLLATWMRMIAVAVGFAVLQILFVMVFLKSLHNNN